jgi:hypothetical protein
MITTNDDGIVIPSLSSIKKLLEPLNYRLDLISQKLNQTEPKSEPKKYYRNEDLKAMFKFSNNTIIKYRENGTLPFTKMGDIYLYDVKAIDAILKKNNCD